MGLFAKRMFWHWKLKFSYSLVVLKMKTIRKYNQVTNASSKSCLNIREEIHASLKLETGNEIIIAIKLCPVAGI